MALMKCTECGHDVSDQAAACPHCGVKIKPPKKAASPLATVIVVLIGGYLVYSCTSTTSVGESASKPREFSNIDALTHCQLTLEKLSRDPATAEVPYVPGTTTAESFEFNWNNGTKPVRMKNGFGALLSTSASCTVDRKTRSITSLTLDGKTVF